jgi:hypothetical protein
VPKPRIVTLPPAPDGSSPFDESKGAEGEGQPPGQPGPVAAAAAEPPLPSREETERQIRETAARMQRENARRLTQQQQDIETVRDDERRRFLDELRMILEAHGRQAGPEIEELSIRSGRDEDPIKRRMAYRVMSMGRQSQRMKVHHLREIGVSEPVILDFLANEVNQDRGSRNGPRTPNDVWVKAARLLLSYEVPPPRTDRPPPAPGQPANPPSTPPPTGDASRVP